MVQNMITLLSVMIALLLVLIAINAVLRWLNPRNINGEEAAAFRAHRQNVFGFLALAVLFLGAYVGVSVLDNSVFFAVNSAVTPGLVYGSRLLVKLLATVAGIAILVIVLLLLLGMVVCGARSVWYAVFNKQDKVKEIKEGSLLFKPDVSVSSTYQTRYIASIDEYVPVHCYDPKRGENLTQPAMDLEKHPMKTRIVVIALNPKGTRIVAIYLIINN